MNAYLVARYSHLLAIKANYYNPLQRKKGGDFEGGKKFVYFKTFSSIFFILEKFLLCRCEFKTQTKRITYDGLIKY